MRTPGEQQAYVKGMRAGALRVRIATEGQFKGDVREAEEFVNGIADFLERSISKRRTISEEEA